MVDDKVNALGAIKAELHAEFIENTAQSSMESDAARILSQQDASAAKLLDAAEDNSVAGMVKKTQKLERTKTPKTNRAKKAQESVLIRKEDADGLADQFSRRQGNREYHLDRNLLSRLIDELGEGITENSTEDEIISIIRKRMSTDSQPPDVAIVDKAFEFLLDTSQLRMTTITGGDKARLEKIQIKIENAKRKYYDANKAEIDIAQKIIGAVDAVVGTTGQTVKETLDRYRDVVHNPPDLQALRKFYETKGYKAMILELKGLNSYLGSNLKRTHMENPELAQLAAATRKMQALLGVYRQSKIHLSTAENYLALNKILAA